MEGELGQVFTWHNASYPCLSGGDIRTSEYDSAMGGMVRRDGSTLVVRANLFAVGSEPVARDLVTFNGRKMRIEDIRRAPNRTLLVWSLTDPNE